eukprot:TRINITY_DN10052_c0_g1_i1.p1 TRINITY_DN10052_c0_g1~~TRINITY_DN10052_c0_g1_i1.p1  ORF type:complete len:648 (-),score=174.69 TRINITY_DN10052_c0_g1_i1:91-2034(-)
MPSPFRESHDSFVSSYTQTGHARVLGTSRIVQGLHKSGEPLLLRLCLSKIQLNDQKTSGEYVFAAMFEPLKENSVTVRVDKTGVIKEISGAYREIFLYEKSQLIGQNISIFMTSPHSEQHTSYMERYLKTRESKVLGHVRNFTARDKNGNIFPISLKVDTVQKSSKPDDLDFVGLISKIGSEIETFVTIDHTGVITSSTNNIEVLFGYTSDEVIGKNIKILMTSPHAELHDLYLKRYFNTGQANIVGKGPRQVYARHKDKSKFIINLEVEKFVAEKGEVMFRGKMSRVTSFNVPQDTDDMPNGTILGYYSLGNVLGKGYFGKVRMAIHLPTGEKIAIKTLRKKQYESVGMVFPPREIAILKKLRHKFVAGLYDIIVIEERIHLIEEFISGGELFDYLTKRSYFKEKEARHFFRQIVEAVLYIHSRGVVHRDLKLENCLLDNCGNVKVIDFGLGNFYDGKTLLKTFCGSVDYAAPELWQAKEYPGPEVDVWSLGVILYLMLTGFLPFGDADAIVTGIYSMPKHISPAAQDLISRILTKREYRMTMEDLRSHPWMIEGYGEEIPAYSNETPIVIDEEVLQEMPKFGYDVEMSRKSILNDEHNQIVTTYFLLLQKKYRETQKKEGNWFDEIPMGNTHMEKQPNDKTCVVS